VCLFEYEYNIFSINADNAIFLSISLTFAPHKLISHSMSITHKRRSNRMKQEISMLRARFFRSIECDTFYINVEFRDLVGDSFLATFPRVLRLR